MAQAPKCKACGKSHWGVCVPYLDSSVHRAIEAAEKLDPLLNGSMGGMPVVMRGVSKPAPFPVESGGVDLLSVLRRLVARIHAGGPIRGTDEHLEACRVEGVEPCRSPLKKYSSPAERQRAYRERKRKDDAG